MIRELILRKLPSAIWAVMEVMQFMTPIVGTGGRKITQFKLLCTSL